MSNRPPFTEMGTNALGTGQLENQGIVSIHVKSIMSTGQSSEDEYWVYMYKVQGKSQDMQLKLGNHQ